MASNTESSSQGKLGFAATWALVAGGMVGGGIYTALGVVIAVAAQWAWLSFAISGVIALTSAYSYAVLANQFQESGGAFEFLREIDHQGIAGSLSWILIVGYVLTMAVYAFAFGHYLAYALGGGAWLMRLFAVGIMAALIALNLLGTGKMSSVEIVIVAGNLFILVILAIAGLTYWQPVQLVAGIEPRGAWGSVIGAASIFMSYEGFQLLTYEYQEIREPQKILKPVLISAVAFVIGIYIVVTLGATMLAGALSIIEEKQIALSIAAEEAGGNFGLIIMTVAAGCATAAAINSTLFSTAKLAKRVADDGELPRWFEHRNGRNVPDRAVILLGSLAALLSITGSLSSLVEAASLAFLFTFGTVNLIATQFSDVRRWIPRLGTAVAILVALVLMVRLAITATIPLIILLVLAAIAIFGRSAILEKFDTE